MTITRINEDTVMFEIRHEEVPVQDEEDLIYYVIDLAVTAEKLDIKNSAFLLELTSSSRGLVFMLTVKKKRKHYKIIRRNSTVVFCFECLEHFLNCMIAMYKSDFNYPDSSTYIMNDRYYLCTLTADTGAKILMSEYGEEVPHAQRFINYLKEHGNRLTSQNSIKLIGESFIGKDFSV